jgi:hypothetical protein
VIDGIKALYWEDYDGLNKDMGGFTWSSPRLCIGCSGD